MNVKKIERKKKRKKPTNKQKTQLNQNHPKPSKKAPGLLHFSLLCMYVLSKKSMFKKKVSQNFSWST